MSGNDKDGEYSSGGEFEHAVDSENDIENLIDDHYQANEDECAFGGSSRNDGKIIARVARQHRLPDITFTLRESQRLNSVTIKPKM